MYGKYENILLYVSGVEGSPIKSILVEIVTLIILASIIQLSIIFSI